MLCEKCKKNEAKINLVKVVNGEKQQIWLCEECAKNISSIPFLKPIGEGAGFPFQEMIKGLISSVEDMAQKEEKLVCSKCGSTFEEFKKTGRPGCQECYRVFRNIINDKVKDSQPGAKHVGRIPKIGGKELLQRNKLKNLKQQLQVLIQEEEYEKAAVVRDEIKEIELYIIESNVKDNESGAEGEKYNEKLDS